MSSHIVPKEHRTRKPRAGFEKIKKQHWEDLKTPKEEIEIRPTIELSEQAKFRIRKKKQRSLLIQFLVFTLILVPLTFVSVNYFYSKVEATHKKLAPHHYEQKPPPHYKGLHLYWKRGYIAFANKDYEKAVLAFNSLNKDYHKTTFGLTGLILSHAELCKKGDNTSCDFFEEYFARYKHYYTLRNQDDDTILKELRAFTQKQIENVLKEQSL